jgi:GNAT superfamily N-acetyltransferase
MISSLKHRYFQFQEYWEEHGFLFACKVFCFLYQELVPAEKDLTHLRPVQMRKDNNFQLLDIGPENFSSLELKFPLRSRREKATGNFRRGYRMIAMVRNGKVVGDLWYVTRDTACMLPIHTHLQWFGINLGKDEVYLFNMYIDPRERGRGLANFFLGSVLHLMYGRGFRKAYGFFVANNIPSLWMHRMLGYRELSRFILRRYFLYNIVRPKI